VSKMLRLWDPFQEMAAFERDFDRLLTRSRTGGYPPVNVYTDENDVMITSEIPGIDPATIDLSVTGDTLTLKGDRKPQELKNGDTWHRQERGYGSFSRTIRLPYIVEGNKVNAAYEHGVLTITLPRSEADKPRKINVSPAE